MAYNKEPNQIHVHPVHQPALSVKIYTFSAQHRGRRIAWYEKEHEQEKYLIRRVNPNDCYACGQLVEVGEKVVTRLGRTLSHVYHYKCAKRVNVV